MPCRQHDGHKYLPARTDRQSTGCVRVDDAGTMAEHTGALMGIIAIAWSVRAPEKAAAAEAGDAGQP